jgi:hypothetical protein
MKGKIFVVLSAVALAAAPAGAADQKIAMLDESRPMVARSAAAQRFADYVDVKPGQEKLPLTLTFYNGTDKAPGFAWLRISIGGRPYFTEKDFKGGKVFSASMTGDLGTGSTQVLVNGAGPPGATLSWQLTTPAPTVDAVRPDKASTGQTINLSGSNFSAVANYNTVTVGGKTVELVSAKPNSLEVKIPDDAKAGKNEVVVSVLGLKTEPVSITVLLKPKVTGLNLFSAPPGQPVVISGQNFSPNARENKVTIGDFPAQITEASPSSLTAIIPEGLDPIQPAWYLPVVVEVNGIKSNDDVTLNVQNRYIESESVSPQGPFD